MKACLIFLIGILTSCKSVELAKPISYFFPKSVTFGASLSQISIELGMDTTKYKAISTYGHIKGRYIRFPMKRYMLGREDLEALKLKDNLYDSILFTFYKDHLYSTSFHLSNNQKIEILKFRLNSGKRFLSGHVPFQATKVFAPDTSFYSAGSRELTYSYSKNRINYFYQEDIVDNIAVLHCENIKMKKLFR